MTGLDPAGMGEREFRVESKRVDHLMRNGPPHVYYALKSAEEVLASPTVIYEGLRREGFEKGLCYCGKPRRYLNEGIEAPAPPGKVFTVYINERDVVFEWRWDKADEFDPSVPNSIKTRFERIKWKAQ